MRNIYKQGSWWFIQYSRSTAYAVPTLKEFANARLLRNVDDRYAIVLAWKSNYNTRGDFRTEEMIFIKINDESENSSVFELDLSDVVRRNKLRKQNGLLPVLF